MFKTSVAITFLYLLSGFLGFGCQLLYTRFFGVNAEMDIYFTLLSIPSIIIGMVPVIFSSVFIPVFATKKTIDSLNIFIVSLSKNVLIFSFFFSLLGGILSIFNLDLILNDLNLQQQLLARRLIMLFWISAFFSINNGLLSSILTYKKKFIQVSFVSLLTYVGIIISLLLLKNLLGVKAIAIGMSVASMLQFIIYVFYIKILTFKKIWKANLIIPDGIQLLKNIFFVIVSLMPFTLLAPIAYWRALSLPEGSVSYLGYSYSFCGFLSVVTSMGVSIVSFPDWAKKIEEKKNSKDMAYSLIQFEKTLKLVIFIAIFISIFLIYFSFPIVKLLLYRGVFDLNSVRNLSNLLPCYLLTAIFISAMNLIRNLYYSMKKYKIIALISAMIPILHFILSGIFKKCFSYLGIGMSDTICMCMFFSIALLYIHIKNIKKITRSFFLDIAKCLFVSFLSGFLTFLMYSFFISELGLFYSICISGVVYCVLFVFIVTYFIHIEEMYMFFLIILKNVNFVSLTK